MSIQLIDIFEDFGKSWNLIKIYRDSLGKKHREEITDFIDYFYSTESKLIELLKNEDIKRQIIDYDLCKIPAYGTKETIYKINLKGIWSKFKIRKSLEYNLKDTFELDVESSVRYVVDNIKEMSKTKYRVLYFDIETTTDEGFPNWKNAKEKITCITYYDSYEKIYNTFVLKPEEDKEYENDNENVYFFSDEKDMIMNFINLVRRNDFDILTGWNISFDLTYIFGRCDELGLDKSLLSPVGKVDVGTKTNKQGREEIVVDIKQRFVIDLLLRYKINLYREIPSYSLDYVSEYELGKDNKKKKVLDFSEEWRNHLDDLITYSIRDVEILVKLDDKLNLIDYVEELRLINNLPNINQATTAKNLIDIAILREYKDKLLMPSKLNLERKKIGGGYVRVPTPGLYYNVAVFDFKSLYPSLIQTFNLSKDTIVPVEEADFVTVEDDIDEDKLERQGYTTGWSLKTIGIIPTILENFLNLRKRMKEEMKMYDYNSIEYHDRYMRQYALKAPINANYGINCYPGFRLYEPRVAATITYLGRKLTTYCIERIEDELDLDVVYADTDSLFVQLKDGITPEDILKKINEKYVLEFVEKYSNGKVKNNKLIIDFELVYDKLILLKKRRYIGYNKKEDEWVYKGVDIKRNNTPVIIKDLLKICIEKKFEGINDKLITKECFKILDKCTDFDMFKIPMKISKEYLNTLPQVRAKEWANKHLKLNIKLGSKFYGIYVNSSETDIIGFMDVEELKDFNIQINKEKYRNMLISKFTNLNISKSDIIFDIYQSNITDYF